MILPEEDVKLFYKLNWGLLHYVNRKYYVIPTLNAPDFRGQKPETVWKLHEKLFSNPGTIDAFVAENPQKFNEEELAIIRSWKNNFVKGPFFIVSHQKEYSVFLDSGEEPRAYGVLGLYDEIEDVTSPDLPTHVDTVLLPFKGKIIYCGIVSSYNVYFGGGPRRGITADYQQAKSRFGVILSLEAPICEKKEADEELLRFYVKNENNRMEYPHEIDRILEKNPSLWKVYHQEIGRSNSRKAAKRFSEIGLSSTRWFAIFEDIIIASGQSEQEVRSQVEGILPEGKRDYAYVFKYRGK